jgi:hypothetical protein
VVSIFGVLGAGIRLLALEVDDSLPGLLILSGVVVELNVLRVACGVGSGLDIGDLAIPSYSFALSLTLGPLVTSIPVETVLGESMYSLIRLDTGDLERVGDK